MSKDINLEEFAWGFAIGAGIDIAITFVIDRWAGNIAQNVQIPPGPLNLPDLPPDIQQQLRQGTLSQYGKRVSIS